MKIGFSILTHRTPDLLFRRLIAQLDRFPGREIAVHHDFHQAEFAEDIRSTSSLHLVKNYLRTYWSHVNNVTATMETFKILYSKHCDWFVTLSANCYPIKSPAFIIDFLAHTSFDGFIERNNVLKDHFDFYKYFRRGFDTRYLFKIPFISKKGQPYKRAIRMKRSASDIIFGRSFIPYHGSDWIIVNRKSIEYLLKNQDKINALLHFLRDVNRGPDINVCPPEIVFQTILGNSSEFNFSENYHRFIDWENAKDWHPNIITLKHWEAIKNTDALLARKFDFLQSREVVELIDSEIL